MEYPLRYDVEASSRLEAIMAAGAKLRSGVIVTQLRSAEPWPTVSGWWTVVLDVREGEPDPPEPQWLHEVPEYADPMTAAKAEADRC